MSRWRPPDEQGRARFMLLAGLHRTASDDNQQDRGTDQRCGEGRTNLFHVFAFFGCKRMTGSISLVSRTSLRLLNGILKAGRPATRIMAKFNAAPITWRNGSVRYSKSSLAFSCNHPISRLKSSNGARHQLGVSA